MQLFCACGYDTRVRQKLVAAQDSPVNRQCARSLAMLL